MSRARWTKLWLGLCTAVLALASGCTSVRTTHFTQRDDKCSWDTKHMRGVPVTFKVPTHFEIRIIESQYVRDNKELVTIGNDIPLVTRHVLVHVRETDELMTVDFVKPAAGKSDIKSTLNNQYFTEVAGTVNDKTIESITKSIATLTTLLPAKGAKQSFHAPGDGGEGVVQRVDSIVASVLIAIHDCEAEAKIQAFLDQHLNRCRPGCVVPVQPQLTPPAPVSQSPTPMAAGPK